MKEKAEQKFKERQEGNIKQDPDDHGETFPLPASEKMNELAKDYDKKCQKEIISEFQTLKSTVENKEMADAMQKEFDQTLQGNNKLPIEEVKNFEDVNEQLKLNKEMEDFKNLNGGGVEADAPKDKEKPAVTNSKSNKKLSKKQRKK